MFEVVEVVEQGVGGDGGRQEGAAEKEERRERAGDARRVRVVEKRESMVTDGDVRPAGDGLKQY